MRIEDRLVDLPLRLRMSAEQYEVWDARGLASASPEFLRCHNAEAQSVLRTALAEQRHRVWPLERAMDLLELIRRGDLVLLKQPRNLVASCLEPVESEIVPLHALTPEPIEDEPPPPPPVMTIVFMVQTDEQFEQPFPRYTLRSMDGSYDISLAAKDDTTLGDDLVELCFKDLVPGQRYTLEREDRDGSAIRVFEDLPYGYIVDRPRPEARDLLELAFIDGNDFEIGTIDDTHWGSSSKDEDQRELAR